MTDIMISKCRPSKVDDIVGQAAIVKRLKRYLEQKQCMHMLFTGNPGIGKTTAAMAFVNELYEGDRHGNVLELNASDERGIDVIRHKVQNFAKIMSMSNVGFKVIFLDEADHLTGDAQATLRRVMEDFSATNRFILSCNYIHKIIAPIQDRCAVFRFKDLKQGDIYEGVNKVVKNSKIEIHDDALQQLAKSSRGSMRKALNILEDVSIGKKLITKDDVIDITGSFQRRRIGELIKAARDQNFREANTLYYALKVIDKMNVTELIHEMIQYIDETANIPPDVKFHLFKLLAEVEWRASQGADDWIQFRWFIAQVKDIKDPEKVKR